MKRESSSSALRWVGGLFFALILTGCPPPCGGEGQECCIEAPLCSAGLACGGGTCIAVDPVFPANYRSEYTRVRECRRSIEHDFSFVEIYANDVGAGPYLSREGGLPDGSIFVKELYGDPDCEDLIGFAAMERVDGIAPDYGDWHWQDVAPDRTVLEDGPIAECQTCHEECGVPPDGFDWTCTVP